jgi:hypothetical protein
VRSRSTFGNNDVYSNLKDFVSQFINYARKPQAFKPGDEWHPFEAKPGETWRSGANSGMIWLWPDI